MSAASEPLARLNITHEVAPQVFPNDAQVQALFNPNHLRYEARADWRSTPTIQQSVAAGYQRVEFQTTPPPTLTVELFFDTYENAAPPGQSTTLSVLQRALLAPDQSATPRDVRRHTDRVAQLATVHKALHRPPVCLLRWGSSELFRGVLTQLQQDFTFFLSDGTPVRATLACTFMAHRSFAQAAAASELQSVEIPRRRVVRRGDTLLDIAMAEYNDPALWRELASANNIDNPRVLPAGTVLIVPKLKQP